MYAHRGKKVQLLVFWDRSRNGRHLINYRHCLQHISCYFNRGIDTVKMTPLNRQLVPWNFHIQYSYLHSNVIMCNGINCQLNSRKYPFTGSANSSPVNSICDHQISNGCREIFKYNHEIDQYIGCKVTIIHISFLGNLNSESFNN
jgi:hypothetical protein